MITLFTGMPGAGKTAALVDLLSKLPGDRPIYVDGLDGLSLPHTVCNASDWHTELPNDAILVIDEVQRVWRPRGSTAKVPDAVAALETHRHQGIDIYLTTQAPRLLDANVRGLVGRHVHIRDTGWLGRHWYEWPECNDGMAWKTCPVKKSYKLPAKAFDLYKSSSGHHKPIRTTPPALYWAIAFIALALILGVFAYRTFGKKPEPVEPAKPELNVPAPLQTPTGYPGQTVVAIDDRIAWIPRVSNKPESAPAYDHLRVVVAMPQVVGGMCDGDTCRCITQQGTDAGLGTNECRTWLKNPPFNPYKQPPRETEQNQMQAAPVQNSQNMAQL